LSKDNLTLDVERKVLQAYDMIHDLGVFHNDVRRENIVICQPENSVYLIDFEFSSFDENAEFAAYERQNVEKVIQEVKSRQEQAREVTLA